MDGGGKPSGLVIALGPTPYTKEAIVNLKESVRQWVLRELPYDSADADLVAYLNGLDAHGLLVVYHNWMNRLVRPQPRQVRKSRAFEQNPIFAQRKSDIDQIIADIEEGRDVRKYLSRDIKIPVQNPRKKSKGRRRDLDLMLNDWGVHHLHISTQIEPNGFVKRDGPLLFAVFKPQVAYLIDVMKHRDWTRVHVLEVLATEWSDEGVIYEVIGILDGPKSYTDEERAKKRAAGLSAPFVKINGRFFAPAGGITATGTSDNASINSGHIMRTLALFEERIRADPIFSRTVLG
jgi:hypothetical protein